MIRELTGEYRFLSNFWSCHILHDQMMFPSVENAYQAAKCKDLEDKFYFLTCKASEAKRRGKIVEIRDDWESIKTTVMYELVKQKFTNHHFLKELLLRTDTEEIQEGNWWGDTFWGTVNGKGSNTLGKILMRVRRELSQE